MKIPTYRMKSAPSEKFIKALPKEREINKKMVSHRDKSQSISQITKNEKKINSENFQLLTTFNPNSKQGLIPLLKEENKKNSKEKEYSEKISSNTPSFHTKYSNESSISTTIDCSFGPKQHKNKEFSIFEKGNLVFGKEEKKNEAFPKCLFKFINKKQKLFV